MRIIKRCLEKDAVLLLGRPAAEDERSLPKLASGKLKWSEIDRRFSRAEPVGSD